MTTDSAAPPDAVRLQLLVVRCQAGDERAFGRLMATFGDRTLRYLRQLVGDAADDVQQEVWLTVYRNIHHLVNPAAFRTWLFRTTRHRAIDCLRRQRLEQRLFVDLDQPGVLATAGTTEPAPSLADLDAAMSMLSPLHREVLLLRYHDDLSYADIALVIGCPVGTVRSRLHHARRLLAARISPQAPPETARADSSSRAT